MKINVQTKRDNCNITRYALMNFHVQIKRKAR